MEKITSCSGDTIAIIDNLDNIDNGLKFYGSIYDYIQIGTFKYNSGKVMRDHAHIKRDRIISKTQEILIVWRGSCEAKIWELGDDNIHRVVFTSLLKSGDFLILYSGGVGYKVLEDNTIMLEAKIGPFDIEKDEDDRMLLCGK